jgi:hypothetical protein
MRDQSGFSATIVRRLGLPHPGPQTPEDYFASSEAALRSAYLAIEQCAPYTPGPIVFSQAFLAGLILQAAYTAIKLYAPPPPRPIPAEWRDYIEPDQDAAQFCIGRSKYNVPTGLIVYAGRNQFAHWDQNLHTVPRRVFELLANAFDDNPHWDMVFELETGVSASFCAGPVLFLALEWLSYDTYLIEMTELLKGSSEHPFDEDTNL